MADQDSPLDLTVKKPEAEPCEQDGVLDLSVKKSCTTGTLSPRNSQGCLATLMKGESLALSLAKLQDLQSTCMLEQFMAKLCLHHQHQIVDALGYLQTEVKTVGSSCCQEPSSSKTTVEVTAEGFSQVPHQGNIDSSSGETVAAVTTSSAIMSRTLEMDSLPNTNSSLVQQLTPEKGCINSPCESCMSLADPVNLRKVTPGNSRGSSFLLTIASERENVRHEDLLLLARKNTSSGSLAEVKKYRTLASACLMPVGTLDEQQCSPQTLLHPVRDELDLEELNLSIARHSQVFDRPYHTGQRASSGITKYLFVSPCPAKKDTKTAPAAPRTARKSSRGTYPRLRHSVCHIIKDADSHCDIVYISKPITQCELQPTNHIFPRCNARKSTRGFSYMEEICELRTVRTLAGKPGTNIKDNCPAPVLETSTPLTPKRSLSKPESVPPVDIPFSGGCGQTFCQKAALEQPIDQDIAGDDVAAIREADLIVETSQTDQPPVRETTTPLPYFLSSSVNQQSAEVETEGQLQEMSQAEETVDHFSAQPEVGVMHTLLLPDDLPDHDAAAGDEIASVGEAKYCSSEFQWSSRPTSPMLATEDSVKLKNIRTNSDLSKPDQCPGAVVAEDQEIPMHAKKECMLLIPEEHVKEHSEEQETMGIDPVSRETNNMVPEENMRDAVGKLVEAEAVKELSMEIKDLKHTEKEGSQVEVVVIPSEVTVPRHVSSRDIVPSDRCLRRRPQPISSEPTTVSKISEVTPHLLLVQDSPVNVLRMSAHPHRSFRVKPPTVFTSSDCVLQSTGVMPIDKLKCSSEFRPRIHQVVDNVVQTRHQTMLAKQLGKEKGSQGRQAASAATAGSCAEMIELMIPNQPTHLKEKPVECNPGDCSMTVENASEMCREMPLVRERSRGGLPSVHTLMKHKKLVLGSQRCSTLAHTKMESEQDQAVPDIKTRAEKALPSQSQKRDLDPFGLQKLNLSMPNPPKFLEALRGEEHQPKIMSLNTKYDKMQRGWLQLDKEGKPAQRPKNKADRLKEIWKSKRRVRKPKPLDQQKYSPVQKLFMKTFDLTGICRWFLQTTETKSLVIVKKVNTRLPSETQLCFHSSSVAAGFSHGVFSSLQAERLKKHLKKFAVASPVKSNAKNQTLIAKALEQESPCINGKDKAKDMTSATRISTKPYSNPHKLEVQVVEGLEAAAAIKNTKYTNIREKLHVQQHALESEEIAMEDLRSTCIRPLLSPKLCSKALPDNGKNIVAAGENGVKELYVSKNVKVNSLPSSKTKALRKPVKEKGTKSSRNSSQILSKKGCKTTTRVSAASLVASRPGKPSAYSLAAPGLRCGVAVPSRASKVTREPKRKIIKSVPLKARGLKLQIKYEVQDTETVQLQRPEPVLSPTQDQVLTRSQRKMETITSKGAVSRPSLKRTTEPMPIPTKRNRTLLLK